MCSPVGMCVRGEVGLDTHICLYMHVEARDGHLQLLFLKSHFMFAEIESLVD